MVRSPPERCQPPYCARETTWSPTYSREELVAEFAVAFLCNEAGIDNTIQNSGACIQGWAKAINKDKRLVVAAASQGQKATHFILGDRTGRLAGRTIEMKRKGLEAIRTEGALI